MSVLTLILILCILLLINKNNGLVAMIISLSVLAIINWVIVKAFPITFAVAMVNIEIYLLRGLIFMGILHIICNKYNYWVSVVSYVIISLLLFLIPLPLMNAFIKLNILTFILIVIIGFILIKLLSVTSKYIDDSKYIAVVGIFIEFLLVFIMEKMYYLLI